MAIDTSGCSAFLKALESVQKIDDTVKPFLEKCSELAFMEAQNNFAHVAYDGTNDVVVNQPVISGNSAKIEAVGETVNFIEFGTGFIYNNIHPDAAMNNFERGEYGHKRGKSLTGWLYKDDAGSLVHTLGNPSNFCMYRAREEVAERGEELFKEVLGK